MLCRGRGLSVKYGWAHKSKSPSQPLFRKENYFYSAINNDLSAAHTNLRAKVIIFLLLVIVQQAELNAHILLKAGKTKYRSHWKRKRHFYRCCHQKTKVMLCVIATCGYWQMLGINLNISMSDILSPLGAFLSQYVTPTNNSQHLLLMEIMRKNFLFLCCLYVVKLRRLTWFCKKLTIIMPRYFMKKKMQISLSASAPE